MTTDGRADAPEVQVQFDFNLYCVNIICSLDTFKLKCLLVGFTGGRTG